MELSQPSMGTLKCFGHTGQLCRPLRRYRQKCKSRKGHRPPCTTSSVYGPKPCPFVHCVVTGTGGAVYEVELSQPIEITVRELAKQFTGRRIAIAFESLAIFHLYRRLWAVILPTHHHIGFPTYLDHRIRSGWTPHRALERAYIVPSATSWSACRMPSDSRETMQFAFLYEARQLASYTPKIRPHGGGWVRVDATRSADRVFLSCRPQ